MKPTFHIYSFITLHRFNRRNILRLDSLFNATSSDLALPSLEWVRRMDVWLFRVEKEYSRLMDLFPNEQSGNFQKAVSISRA
jgi:hypothetical protein